MSSGEKLRHGVGVAAWLGTPREARLALAAVASRAERRTGVAAMR